MDPADVDAVESVVDRELRRLPHPRAPRSLLPGVLAATDQWASRPWYARAWLTWPRPWQVASVVTLAVLIVGLPWATSWARSAGSRTLASTALSGTTLPGLSGGTLPGAALASATVANTTAAGAAVASTTTRTVGQVAGMFQGVETTGNAVRLVWLALVQPVFVYAFGFVTVMFSTCILLGIAINRVIFGKVFQS
jgi:hypothetical protein